MDNLQNTEHQCSCGSACATTQHPEVHKVQSTEATPKAEPGRAYIPAVDIVDNDADTLLVLDMPGVNQDNIDLTLEKNILTIEAKPAEMTFEGKTLVYSEYGVGDFRRAFSLSEDIDRDNITASLKDGVLTVKLTKTAPVTKKITVG